MEGESYIYKVMGVGREGIEMDGNRSYWIEGKVRSTKIWGVGRGNQVRDGKGWGGESSLSDRMGRVGIEKR